MRSRLASAVALVALAACGDSAEDAYRVMSCNMAPTLGRGDTVELIRPPERLDRGDIVYFTPTGRDDDLRVSRIVALGGDHVGFQEGRFLLNGEPVDEPYLRGAPSAGPTAERAGEVPPEHVYVMGDNRTNSADSRFFGPIRTELVRAEAARIKNGSPGAGEDDCDE